jgi:hypothetical protein
MKYGIIFWGNSFDTKKVFILQKKIVRLMIGVKSCNSCKDLQSGTRNDPVSDLVLNMQPRNEQCSVTW